MAQVNVADLPPETSTGEFDELLPGKKLLNGQYTITRFLNSGGFGITYLAKDSLNRTVVIKECFVSAFCRRSSGIVAARSRTYQTELQSVIKLFVREAQNLARLVHPNIVAVHQVFEDNGTAYMALDYIEGRDLLEIIDDKSAKLPPDEVVWITEKLLSAVKFIHENGMLHRDISPDNVLIDRTGEPILIDFGAAREDAVEQGRALTTMRVVKDGYSPHEFYVAGSVQGPFSDLHALGATLYHVITGRAPDNSQLRLAAIAEGKADPCEPLAGRFAGYPVGFLEAIDTAMKCLPKDRVQSASDWMTLFRTPGVLPILAARRVATVPQIEAETKVPPTALLIGQPGIDAVAEGHASRKTLMGWLAGGAVAVSAAAVLALVLTGGSDGAAEVAGAVAAKPLAVAGPVAEVAAGKVPAAAEATVEVATDAASAKAAVADAEAAATPATDKQVAAEAGPAPDEDGAAGIAADAAPIVAAGNEAVAAVAATEPAAETAVAAPEPAVETAVAAPAAAPEVLLADQQIAFAAWDVRMPFVEADRLVDGQPAVIVSRINPTADLSVSGSWLQPGLTITAVNDTPITRGATVAGLVLADLEVDPDGYARAAVRYVDPAGQQQTGLLAVQTLRLVSLANGVSFVAEYQDGRWVTKVGSIDAGATTTLQEGDVILRELFTGAAIDGPQTVETVMPALIERKRGTVELSVIRGSKLETAYMQLAIKSATAGSE